MLTHLAVGPLPDGSWIVAYMTPGLSVMTVACPCPSKSSAIEEAKRRNVDQQKREDALHQDSKLRGIGGGFYHSMRIHTS